MAPATDERGHAEADEVERNSGAEKRVGLVVAGTYRITRHIGSGGSSHVFEAEHVRLGSQVALKLLRPELDNSRKVAQRFRREARALARLRSEHIVTVLDCGELDDGTPYLVMELLRGEDLRSLLNREGSLPARRAVQIIIEACRGLTVVHDAGLVHRDLKPENLFITRRGTGEDWCKVLDFGIAKMDASLSTAEGAIVGTVRYMAPEQLSDGAAVGPATDVYALGAILYECLCGKPAHGGDTIQKVMFSVMNTELDAPSLVRSGVPEALAAEIERCLAKGSTRRHPTAADLARRLSESCFEKPSSNLDATLADDSRLQGLPESRRARRSPPAWYTGTALALAALTGGAVSWSVKSPKLAEPTPVQQSPIPLAASTSPPREARPPMSATPAPSTSDGAPAAAAPSMVMHGPSPGKPRLTILHSAASAQVRPRSVPVGNFDQANPYGE